jgi:diacylglycerol kinase family enzyme
MAPGANGCDGLLDVSTFRRGRLWHGLRYLAYVSVGRPERLADCTRRLARRIRIESDQPGVPYQLDGDPGGVLPLDIEVLPERVTLLVPRVAAFCRTPQPAAAFAV